MNAATLPVRELVGEIPTELALTPADLDDLVAALADYHAHFAPFFRRSDQRAGAQLYLRGLLIAAVPRKNVEAMALRLLGAGPNADNHVRALQYFISHGAWDDAAILCEHQRLVEHSLGEEDGVLIIDGSDVAKQGTHSVGVSRQWCGASGKIDNCQAGVYLGYASRRGYTLLDRRLYLPPLWFSPDYAERWQDCAIPATTTFKTKHELAGELVAALMAQQSHIRARWLTCDEGFGDDPRFLDGVASGGLWYLAEVPLNTQVWPLQEPKTATARLRPTVWVPAKTGRKGRTPLRPHLQPSSPAKMTLAEIAAQVPAAQWQRYRILEGSKGPLVADFVALRAVAVRAGLPGPDVWLLLRRKISGPADEAELKYYLSNAVAETPLAELVRVSGMRWPIESCFAEAKGELGLDHYEMRFWRGWHHHMTLVILAHHFLVQLQAQLDQREGGPKAGAAAGTSARGAVGTSQCEAGSGAAIERANASQGNSLEPERNTAVVGSGSGAAKVRRASGARLNRLPTPAQGSGLSFTPQAHAAAAG